MKRRNTQREGAAVRRPGSEGARALARKPWVQAVLVAAAALQVVATQAERPGEGMQEVVRLAPAVVRPQPTGSVTEAWRRKAVERESERLAAGYRSQGFEVPTALAMEIHEAATENGIDPELAFGLVRAESSFRNVATSRVGAVGLTQLMPATARWLEPGVTRRELRDPETNLRIGFRYLKDLIEKYNGNEDLALTAYNRGPGTVDRVLKRGGDPDNGYADFVRTGKKGRHKG